MQKNINVILSLVNMSEKKQQYKTLHNASEINALFKNKPIGFTISDKKYLLFFNPDNYILEVKTQTSAPTLVATFDKTSSMEEILQTFGNL
jgi:hypothetical protein